MIHKYFAVSFSRGLILSATGPGTSALKSCTPPTPKSGNIALKHYNTHTPYPLNKATPEWDPMGQTFYSIFKMGHC
ncbi:hypothetical protein Ct9H90mP29_07970 [bacterium]|nr:MAG: hypothetical protein Ct9H90mP29_07970 [bacterium]